MKIDKRKVYFMQAVLLIFLILSLFVPNIFNKRIIAIVLSVLAVALCKTIKKRNAASMYKKQILIILGIAGVLYVQIFYLMGLYFGYYETVIKFSWLSLYKYIIPTAIIIIAAEYMRNVLIAQKAKGAEPLTFIIMVLIDIVIYVDIYNVNTLGELLEIVGYVLFASIACNLLYNYISKNFSTKSIIIYRLITTLYAYIIPITPNVYIFLRSFFRMVYPYFIYLLLEKLYGKTNISPVSMINKKKRIATSVIMLICMIIMIMLISCQFRFGILVIGSGSMAGTIDIGDVILFEQYEEQKIKEGQIIIFHSENIRIVHRVIDIYRVNGEYRYITKGDANDSPDKEFVTKDQIIGVCKFSIPNIGYPSLWVREIFE